MLSTSEYMVKLDKGDLAQTISIALIDIEQINI